MDEYPAPPAHANRRLLKRIGLSAAAVILAAALGYILLSCLASRGFEAAVAALKARGEPVTAADCAPPEIPEEENGAVLLRRAAEALALSEDEEEEGGGSPFDRDFCEWEGDLPSFRKLLPSAGDFLARREKAMRLLEEALHKKRFRFDLPYEKGLLGDADRVMELSGMSQLLEKRLLVRACDGDPAGALQDVERILLLGKAAVQGGTLFSSLVAAGFYAQASESLKDLLRAADPPEPELARIGRVFAEAAGDDLGFRHALAVERAFAIDNFRFVFAGTAKSRGANPLKWLPAAFVYGDALTYLDRADRIMTALDLPYPAARASVEKAVRVSGVKPFSALLLQGPRDAVVFRARVEALMRITALACLAHARRAEGGPVEKWMEGLPAEKKLDPFTSLPFTVRTEGDALLLLSPGPDGIDAGLTPRAFREKEAEGCGDDLWFYLPPRGE